MNKTIIEFIHELGDGGGSVIVKEYCLRLCKDGYRVIVLLAFPAPETTNYRILKEAGIEIVTVFKNKSFLNRLLNKFFSRILISRKLRILNTQYKPQAIHAHLCVLKYISPIRKSLYGTKLLYTCHSLPEKYFKGKNKEEYYAAVKLLKCNGIQFIALHEEMARQLNEMFGIDNTEVLYNGIDIERFKYVNENKKDIRESIGFEDSDYIIGHVGRFTEPKNHKFIIESFYYFSKKNPSARLLLIGAGDLLPGILNSIKQYGLTEKIKILSHRTDVERLMKAMDVFVFPSLYEGLGIAVVEAQAAGLTCIISDNIPKFAIVTNQTICLSLNDSLDKWSEAFNGIGEFLTPYSQLSKYDMNLIIKKLESLYE